MSLTLSTISRPTLRINRNFNYESAEYKCGWNFVPLNSQLRNKTSTIMKQNQFMCLPFVHQPPKSASSGTFCNHFSVNNRLFLNCKTNWGSSVYFLKELKIRHLSIWKRTYITPMITVALAWEVLLLII